ncbi:MAG: rod shape-determining protein MreC [Rickettsiales bacterium]|nr:rod shape-determining protein MreC [Rickettsiales bacterium]
MSYSSRSSFFLKIKSITQNQSSSLVKKIKACFFVGFAIIILCVPVLSKRFQIFESFFDKNLSYIHNITANFNLKIKESKKNFFDIFSFISENKRLKLENEKLKVIEKQFSLIKLENAKLKSINKFVFPKTKKIASTKLIFRSDGQVGIAKILIGKKHGIKNGQFAVTDTGVLIGKVIHTYNKTAKILLINEPKSKISVTFPRVMNKAILSGNFEETLNIEFIKTDKIPEEEDLVITSGDDGYFPPGLMIGTVTNSKYGKKFVLPLVNPKDINFVSILEFEGLNN